MLTGALGRNIISDWEALRLMIPLAPALGHNQSIYIRVVVIFEVKKFDKKTI